jgi:hypothetical protein
MRRFRVRPFGFCVKKQALFHNEQKQVFMRDQTLIRNHLVQRRTGVGQYLGHLHDQFDFERVVPICVCEGIKRGIRVRGIYLVQS